MPQELVDYDGGGVVALYDKGHINAEIFAQEALEEYELIIDPEKIEHLYMRWSIYGAPDDWAHFAALYRETGRGRFAVTYYDLDMHGYEYAWETEAEDAS